MVELDTISPALSESTLSLLPIAAALRSQVTDQPLKSPVNVLNMPTGFNCPSSADLSSTKLLFVSLHKQELSGVLQGQKRAPCHPLYKRYGLALTATHGTN